MAELFRPMVDWELRTLIAQLGEKRSTIEVMGAGSKRGIGRPVDASVVLSTVGLKGISLYEPNELVMSARAGTPLSQIESELTSRAQMLAFEPLDYGLLFGSSEGQQTIGGVFATNNSGPRRLAVGGARDHLIGLSGVNGRAEYFKSGGRVMKNVTGYDVARGLVGSWGTLAVFTELTFKVFPLPDDSVTLIYSGLEENIAIELMGLALATPYEVSGAVHLSPVHASRMHSYSDMNGNTALTALRIENFMKSVLYRKRKLIEILSVYGTPLELAYETSLDFWGQLRRLAHLKSSGTLVWRLSAPPNKAAELVSVLRRYMHLDVTYDWSGGLIWLELPVSDDANVADIRRTLSIFGGHATLIRADENLRRQVEAFQPLSQNLEVLSRGLKKAFDPLGLLNPGRMYPIQ